VRQGAMDSARSWEEAGFFFLGMVVSPLPVSLLFSLRERIVCDWGGLLGVIRWWRVVMVLDCGCRGMERDTALLIKMLVVSGAIENAEVVWSWTLSIVNEAACSHKHVRDDTIFTVFKICSCIVYDCEK